MLAASRPAFSVIPIKIYINYRYILCTYSFENKNNNVNDNKNEIYTSYTICVKYIYTNTVELGFSIF